MSRTLIYRTNKEFDKCTELLRNILSVQESRQRSKSPIIRQINRKKQPQSSPNARTKKPNSKVTVTKPSFARTNLHNGIESGECRGSSYSSNKFLHPTIEEPSLSKNRSSPNKSRKHITRSPSPTHQRLTFPTKNSSLINNNSRQKSFPLSIRRQSEKDEELVRSSSCGDLPSSKSDPMHHAQTRLIRDQFVTYLTRIRTLSKQIRHSNSSTDLECSHLWNDLEKSLSSALSYANHNHQFQLSLTPLRNEIIELRKQLQTTNLHLHEYDPTYPKNEQYVRLQTKFDTNQIQCTELLLHNDQLKAKCHLLQDRLDYFERKNTHLIQRLTEQDLSSIIKRTEWISTDNSCLLQEEIILLRKKLYHVYDDLSILLDRNQTFEKSIREQKEQLIFYQQQLNQLKQSAQQLLSDLDHRLIEEKIKRFLNQILREEQSPGIPKRYQTSTMIDSSSCFFDTPSIRTRIPTKNNLRPRSLFLPPNVLNSSNILSKLQHNHMNPMVDVTHCSSSSTIDDADSTITSSSSTLLSYHQPKRLILHHSLPLLTVERRKGEYLNESGPELDQISDLTSKMFGSGDEEDLPHDDINISTSSSSTLPSNAEKLIHM